MVEYTCKRCLKVYTHHGRYVRHIRRKYLCKKVTQVPNIKITDKILPHKVPLKSSETCKIMHSTEKSYKCAHCSNEFTRFDNLNRHMLIYCKIKKTQDDEKEKIFQHLLKKVEDQGQRIDNIQEENKLLKSQLNPTNNNSEVMCRDHNEINNVDTQNNQNTQNNIQTQNIHNNINLLAFGHEDMKGISKKSWKWLLNKGFMSIPESVKHVHFHEKKPDQHNIYISNLRSNYVMVYNGKDWEAQDKDEILNQLLTDKKAYLIDKFDELVDELDEVTVKKFNRFLERHDEDEIINKDKQNIKLGLYNSRKIPEEERKLLKQKSIDTY